MTDDGERPEHTVDRRRAGQDRRGPGRPARGTPAAITAAQAREGRIILAWTHDQLAAAAKLSPEAIVRLEHGTAAPTPDTLDAVRAALEESGVVFLTADDDGPGVRLRMQGM